MTETAVDEQDLAKALDSVSNATASLGTPAVSTDSDSSLQFEETPGVGPVAAPALSGPTLTPPVDLATPSLPTPDDSQTIATPSGPLDDIKKDALTELRPLVDKLTVSAEEKFDTYLLLIRSTDDTSLIAPAHEAAKAITDESRRAEALLDIIKEIDYLSQHKKDA